MTNDSATYTAVPVPAVLSEQLFGPEKKKNPYTGQFYREATDYSGEQLRHSTPCGLLKQARKTQGISLCLPSCGGPGNSVGCCFQSGVIP